MIESDRILRPLSFASIKVSKKNFFLIEDLLDVRNEFLWMMKGEKAICAY